ncbi:MAG: glycoside hydrolase family 3 C-terminal domain-containing protein [Clostridia bacterium]|nr:glycoside hydrolase family 3 C-terminal domain-containing protein [Clostridia bacterium]
MTLKDKISLCTGGDFWHTKEMKEYGIPSVMMCDGPHGLRCQKGDTDMIGINDSLPATCFPTAVTAGATWNRELYRREGEAIGREALGYEVSVVLGPGCNIKRNPLGGRNFEYISEDPYIAGHMAASFIQGVEGVGVGTSLKHFAVNSQEYKRMNGDSRLDERAFREIYLAPFEIAVKNGHPATIMCAYNKINGVHASDNKKLLTDILRDEWGFDGMVVTDWGALYDRTEACKAGCDLNMPGGSKYMENATLKAVKNGDLDESLIDKTVERILSLVKRGSEIQPYKVDFDAHHSLAREIATEGAVLMKNDDNILPLDESDTVIIGYMAEHIRYQGSGSSHINPTKLTNVTMAMPDALYFSCADAYGNISHEEIERAAKMAKDRKVAVVVIGLPDSYESEAFDREHMRLPDGYNSLVNAVSEANPNTVVVLLGGSVMELPFADKVKAILYMGLPGQAGGEAMADLLTGRANPSGKLTESWPISYDDVISKETFGVRDPEYRESIYVGYRYYDKANVQVRYPFGHGLSYTEFAYKNLTVNGREISLEIENIGSVAGKEVVQLYIAPKTDGIFRPVRELREFEKISLMPGETKQVHFTLDDRNFEVWSGGWHIPSGEYIIEVGSSSRDIRLSESITVVGEDVKSSCPDSWYHSLIGKPTREEWERLMGHSIPLSVEPQKGEFTMDNSCMEMKDQSFMMKIQYKVTEGIIAKSFGGKRDMSDPAFKMMMVCATDCPMRSVIISSGGAMNDTLAKFMLLMANGIFSRIKGLFTGAKTSVLSKGKEI